MITPAHLRLPRWSSGACPRTMTDYDLTIPTNFSISDALANFVRVEVIERGYVPCITWAFLNGEEEEEGGPTIGGFEPDQVPEGSLRAVNGVEFVFVLSLEIKSHFDGKILDIADGRGCFLREPN
jgi:hypothetical protein